MLLITYKPNNYPQNIIGTTLILTIFIILIMAAATQFLISLANFNIAIADKIILSKMAIHASKSGIEWGVLQLVKKDLCFNPTTLNFNTPGLNNFSVDITCNSSINSYEIKAKSSHNNIGDKDYVIKTITVNYPRTKITELKEANDPPAKP